MTDFSAVGAARMVPEALNQRIDSSDDAQSAFSAGSTLVWAYADEVACGKVDLVSQLPYVKRNVTGRTPVGIRMAMGRAWSRLLALRVHEALALVSELEPSLNDLDASIANPIRTEIVALRAAGFVLGDDCVAALPAALSCLKNANAPAMTFMAATLCRVAYWKLGDLQRFHCFRREQQMPLRKHHAGLLAFDRAIEAAVELQQLRFGVATRLARDALASASRCVPHASPAGLLPSAVLAQLLYEQGALSEAEGLVRDRLPLFRSRGTPETVVRVYPLLARVAADRKQGDLVLFLLGQGETLGHERGWPRLAAACLHERVELLVQGGRMDEAHSCLERLQSLAAAANRSHYSGAAVYHHCALARARIALAANPCFEIVAVLRDLHQKATAGGDLYLAVQLAIRVAEALGALGEDTGAYETLIRSLELGASVGIHQSFVDGGPIIGRLLATVAGRLNSANLPAGERDRRHLQPYVGSLLSSWRMKHDSPGTSRVLRLNGPLSRRECGILGLIRRGYSNKRIALELGIAPETVKSHAKHIFVKLGAQTRVEAVSRAASLGLI